MVLIYRCVLYFIHGSSDPREKVAIRGDRAADVKFGKHLLLAAGASSGQIRDRTRELCLLSNIASRAFQRDFSAIRPADAPRSASGSRVNTWR
jgi:hypothetical protein